MVVACVQLADALRTEARAVEVSGGAAKAACLRMLSLQHFAAAAAASGWDAPAADAAQTYRQLLLQYSRSSHPDEAFWATRKLVEVIGKYGPAPVPESASASAERSDVARIGAPTRAATASPDVVDCVLVLEYPRLMYPHSVSRYGDHLGRHKQGRDADGRSLLPF